MSASPPRIYGIPATKAPVVAVIRRGPTNWTHVGRWDLAAGRYEPGAWLGGRLFARRSDLSPDGRYLCYFAHKPSATWEHGEAYVAIAKLPWLPALHAFGTCGTWTRGFHFTDDPGEAAEGERLPIPFGLRATPAAQFATERRRGWEDAPGSAERQPADAWDERRLARIRRRQPTGELWLYAESTEANPDNPRARYWLESADDLVPLDDVQWADWSQDGRLLVATRAGALQVRDIAAGAFAVSFEADLARLRPDPAPPPDEARRW